MKHTKQNVIEVLKRQMEDYGSIADTTEDEEFAIKMSAKQMAMWEAIQILTDKEYFQYLVNLHKMQ